MSVQNGSYTRTNSFAPGEDRVIPRFHLESILDPIATEREGRPIYRDREEVELITPGNPYSIPNEIVTNVHRERWPREYDAFKKGHEISPDGTPLEQWPILKRAQILELKALNFSTVEQVSTMSDHATQQFMGGMRLRQLAQAFLDDAKAGALLAQSTAANDRKDAEIAELKRKVEELSLLLNSVHSQMQDLKNAPHPVAAVIPGLIDPIEQAKAIHAEAGGGSALDALPAPRKRTKVA